MHRMESFECSSTMRSSCLKNLMFGQQNLQKSKCYLSAILVNLFNRCHGNQEELNKVELL